MIHGTFTIWALHWNCRVWRPKIPILDKWVICPVTHGPRDLKLNKWTIEVVRPRSRRFTPFEYSIILKNVIVFLLPQYLFLKVWICQKGLYCYLNFIKNLSSQEINVVHNILCNFQPFATSSSNLYDEQNNRNKVWMCIYLIKLIGRRGFRSLAGLA